MPPPPPKKKKKEGEEGGECHFTRVLVLLLGHFGHRGPVLVAARLALRVPLVLGRCKPGGVAALLRWPLPAAEIGVQRLVREVCRERGPHPHPHPHRPVAAAVCCGPALLRAGRGPAGGIDRGRGVPSVPTPTAVAAPAVAAPAPAGRRGGLKGPPKCGHNIAHDDTPMSTWTARRAQFQHSHSTVTAQSLSPPFSTVTPVPRRTRALAHGGSVGA